MADVRFDLSEPSGGWMPVNMRIGGDEIRSAAAYVVDCLTDLVYAALELLERRPVRPILLFEEPEATRLSFVGDRDVIEVAITRHPDLAAAQSVRNGTTLLATSMERIALARAIWSAVRRLEGAIGRDGIEAGWSHRFPAKEIAQLCAELR